MGKVLGISGKMGSGKDTLADILVATSNGRWVKDSFARAVREELQRIYHILEHEQSPYSVALIEAEMAVPTEDARKIARLVGEDIHTYRQRSNDIQKTPLYRTVMQTWATGIRRKQNTNYWVEKAEEHIAQHMLNGVSVVFSDVRFENEARAVINAGGDMIRLHIPEATQLQRLIARDGTPPPAASLHHASETSLDSFQQFSQTYNTARHAPEDILNQLQMKVG